jgi:hypothetical protein
MAGAAADATASEEGKEQKVELSVGDQFDGHLMNEMQENSVPAKKRRHRKKKKEEAVDGKMLGASSLTNDETSPLASVVGDCLAGALAKSGPACPTQPQLAIEEGGSDYFGGGHSGFKTLSLNSFDTLDSKTSDHAALAIDEWKVETRSEAREAGNKLEGDGIPSERSNKNKKKSAKRKLHRAEALGKKEEIVKKEEFNAWMTETKKSLESDGEEEEVKLPRGISKRPVWHHDKPETWIVCMLPLILFLRGSRPARVDWGGVAPTKTHK